jgi:hypothetical protein
MVGCYAQYQQNTFKCRLFLTGVKKSLLKSKFQADTPPRCYFRDLEIYSSTTTYCFVNIFPLQYKTRTKMATNMWEGKSAS